MRPFGGLQRIDHHRGAGLVTGLALGQIEKDRAIVPIADGMKLGGQPPPIHRERIPL